MSDKFEQRDIELATVWETIHKARTILLDVASLTSDKSARDQILKEISFLEQAQSILSKHLSNAGIGLSQLVGAEKLLMPGAATLSRLEAAKADDS